MKNYKEKISWCIIENFPNYEVSSDGNVRNIKTDRILKQINNGYGYLYVDLYNDNNHKKLKVHRLVAGAFLEDSGVNPDGTPMVGRHVVNHKDHDRTNNNVNNLEWCDNRYNNEYSLNKPVICLETNKNYKSTFEAERVLGLRKGSINC